jgi:hypothetical protein
MANFDDIVWNAAQYKVSEMMKKPEFKHKPSPVIMSLMKNTDFLVPASERERIWNTKTDDSHTVEISTLDKQATTAVTARAAAHTGSNNDGTKTTVTFVTRGNTFKYSLKQSDRSVMNQGEMLAAQLQSAIIDLHGTIETYLIGLLNTNKSQVEVRNAAGITPAGYTWDGTSYIAKVAKADQSRAFQRMRGFMRQNYYNGPLEMIIDEFLAQEAEFLMRQNEANATNYGWQFGNLSMGISQELTPDEGYQGMSYVFPMGTVGMLYWNPRMNREGDGDTRIVGGKYRTMMDPLGSGIVFNVHEYASAADNHSSYGARQDVDIEYEVTADVAFVSAPMSTSNASPIFKIGLLE